MYVDENMEILTDQSFGFTLIKFKKLSYLHYKFVIDSVHSGSL